MQLGDLVSPVGKRVRVVENVVHLIEHTYTASVVFQWDCLSGRLLWSDFKLARLDA
jgi:hypothetical protein